MIYVVGEIGTMKIEPILDSTIDAIGLDEPICPHVSYSGFTNSTAGNVGDQDCTGPLPISSATPDSSSFQSAGCGQVLHDPPAEVELSGDAEPANRSLGIDSVLGTLEPTAGTRIDTVQGTAADDVILNIRNVSLNKTEPKVRMEAVMEGPHREEDTRTWLPKPYKGYNPTVAKVIAKTWTTVPPNLAKRITGVIDQRRHPVLFTPRDPTRVLSRSALLR